MNDFLKRNRRSMAVMAMCLLASSAQAEWILLGRSEAFRVYLDKASIKKNGSLVQTVQLMDFVTAQWIDARQVIGSLKTLVEYDCSQLRTRTLAVEANSEQMGEGKLISSEKLPDPQWENVQAGTTDERAWKTACGK